MPLTQFKAINNVLSMVICEDQALHVFTSLLLVHSEESNITKKC